MADTDLIIQLIFKSLGPKRKTTETITELRKLKNGLKHNWKQRRTFFQLIRKISKLRRRNLNLIAKSIVKPGQEQEIELSEMQVFDYFSDLYQQKRDILMKPKSRAISTSFNISEITLIEIKNAIKRSKHSSPGPDQITYSMINNDSTICLLHELFNTILRSSEPPAIFSDSIITLIHKKGAKTMPENYRPIAVTSVISRLYHKIIAKRLQQFINDNNLIDSTVQKGFLPNHHGVIEHPFKLRNLPDGIITLFDLKNAFGSVEHSLIKIRLSEFGLPATIIDYIMRLYSTLRGKFRGPWGLSREVRFCRGVFQGDPLSPLIFLICLEPSLANLKGQGNTPLAYADDCALHTVGKIPEIHFETTMKFDNDLEESGLSIRPDKCVSWRLEKGRILPFTNHIKGKPTKTITAQETTIYLGSIFSPNQDLIVAHITNHFRTYLDIINQANVKQSIKVKVALCYLLPSSYHLLMTSDLEDNDLSILQRIFTDYVYKWSPDFELAPHHCITSVYTWLQCLRYLFLLQSDQRDLILKEGKQAYLRVVQNAQVEKNPKHAIKRAVFGKYCHNVTDPNGKMDGRDSNHEYTLADVYDDYMPTVYTDGSCIDQKKAGWGCFWGPRHPLNSCGPIPIATNNRAELTAAIMAVRQAIKLDFEELCIKTDSTYVIMGITIWCRDWMRNNWRTSKGKVIKNIDLWKRLIQLTKKLRVRFDWVKGHIGIIGNERADELAKIGALTDLEL